MSEVTPTNSNIKFTKIRVLRKRLSLSSISLNNFKSYQDATLTLGRLTVFIGANASGKSNAIEGLRLLSWLAQGNKLNNLHINLHNAGLFFRGRIQNLGYQNNVDFTLSCTTNAEWNNLSLTISLRENELHITAEKLFKSGDAEKPLYHIVYPSSGINADVKVAYNNFKQGKKPQITCTDQMAIFTQLDSPANFTGKAQQIIPDVVSDYQKLLGNILFIDPIPAKMRDYSFTTDKYLQGDGTNLSSVLYHLWGNDQVANQEPYIQQRQTILAFIQSLPEQDIATIGFLTGPRGEVMLELVETFGGQERRYDASLLSDGTLRVLAIAAAMLSATQGSLVVIEEIDNGVHPSRAKHLLEQIQTIAKQRSLRVLLSTHNPAVLDALPDEALPDVLFCYRDVQNGSSRIVRLQDTPDYPELIAQGSLGHLMTSGILERFIKFHPSPEEKRQKALAWLEQMRQLTVEND